MVSCKLTIGGSVQRKDPGKASGVDIERATGQVPQSDLENMIQTKWEISEKPCKEPHEFNSSVLCLTISAVLAIIGFSVLKRLTHVDLIVDFPFQKRTQQFFLGVLLLGARVLLPLSERRVRVFHILHLLIPVAQVMGSCRQIRRLQLTDASKRKDTISSNNSAPNSLSFPLPALSSPLLPVSGFEFMSVVPCDLFDGDEVLPGVIPLSSTGSGLKLWIRRLEAYGVEQRIVKVVVTVLLVFDVTHVDGIGAFLHDKQGVHTIWSVHNALRLIIKTVKLIRATCCTRSRVFFLTVAVSVYLTADEEAADTNRLHFCSDERHWRHFHGDFTMCQHLKSTKPIH